MALVNKELSNFASSRGTPSSNTVWDKVEWSFKASQVKIIVATASLEVSLDGDTIHMDLPIGIHDFNGCDWSRVWVRKTTSAVELYAYGVK